MLTVMKKINNLKKSTQNSYTLGYIDYADILWLKGTIDQLKSSKNPIKRLFAKIEQNKLLDLIDTLKVKDNIKPNSLLDFVNFYISTRDLVDCNYIYGSVSNPSLHFADGQPFNKQYFTIRVVIFRNKRYSEEVIFKTLPSQGPFISISISNKSPDGEKSVSCERMFISISENDRYIRAWEKICDYIKLVILS